MKRLSLNLPVLTSRLLYEIYREFVFKTQNGGTEYEKKENKNDFLLYFNFSFEKKNINL